MAAQRPSQTPPPDLEDEKIEVTTHQEKLEDKGAAKIDDLDINNTHAYKGDSSDGKIEFSWRNLIAAISLAGVYVGAQLPTQLMGASLSYAAKDLHTNHVSWLVTACTLAFAAVAPFVGYVTDLTGRRTIILFGCTCIIVGSIVVGTAHNFAQAVAGMSIAGIGGSIGELNALSGIAEIAPVRLRGLYIGFVTAGIIPFTPYLIYTEELCNHLTWRWNLWITIIWTGFFLCGVIVTYFPPPRHRTEGLTRMEILKRIDWMGGALSIVAVALVLAALQDGGYRYPWSSAHVLAPLIVGVIVFVGFVAWEGWLAPHPMMPPILFKSNRAVPLSLVVATAAGLSLYSIFAFYPLLLQTLYPNETPIQIGVRGLGYGISITVAAVSVNILLSYTNGHVREPLLVSVLVMMAFTGALAKATPHNPNFTTVMGMIAGFGVGGLITPAATVAMICCPDAAIATITGISLCVRAFGGSLGTTIYSVIFNNKITVNLPKDIAHYVVNAGLAASSVEEFVTVFLTAPQNASSIEGVTPHIMEQAALGQSWAYAHSLSYVWYTSVAFAAMAAICCCFIPNIKKQMTNRIAVSFH